MVGRVKMGEESEVDKNDGEREEVLEVHGMKEREGIGAMSKKTRGMEEWTIWGWAGRRGSQEGRDGCKGQDGVGDGNEWWVNLRECEKIQGFSEEEEMLVGVEDDGVLGTIIGGLKSGEVYGDVFFGNGEGVKSKVDWVVNLMARKGWGCTVQWKLDEARGVERSTIEREALSLGEGAETGVGFKKVGVEVVEKKNVHVAVRNESENLEGSMKAKERVESKGLRVEGADMKEVVEEGEMEIDRINAVEQVAYVRMGTSGMYVWQKGRRGRRRKE